MNRRLCRIAFALLLSACGRWPASKPAATHAATGAVVADSAPMVKGGPDYGLAGWAPPSLDSIPDDSLGNSVRRGLYLLRHTRDSLPGFATSNLNCTSCHLGDGLQLAAAPLTGSFARYPKFMPRAGAVVPLADRVNYCFTRSLAGYRLPLDSREMQDILAYLSYISTGVPVGTKIAGAKGLMDPPDTLPGDKSRGQALFARTCSACHGDQGQGMPGVPALWGPKSYSVGASMARVERAASFIQHNMPLGQGGTLSWQEAFDVAAFINSHPRPDSPGKEGDWPLGGAPADVPYATKGHVAFDPPPSLVARKNPALALVPAPASLSRNRQ